MKFNVGDVILYHPPGFSKEIGYLQHVSSELILIKWFVCDNQTWKTFDYSINLVQSWFNSGRMATHYPVKNI